MSSFAGHSLTLMSSQVYHSTATARHHTMTHQPPPSTVACHCPILPTPASHHLLPPAVTHHHLPPYLCFFSLRCLPTTTCHCTTSLLSPNSLPTHHGLYCTFPSPSISSHHHLPLSTAQHCSLPYYTQHRLLSNSCSYCPPVPTIHRPALASHLEVLDWSFSSSV